MRDSIVGEMNIVPSVGEVKFVPPGRIYNSSELHRSWDRDFVSSSVPAEHRTVRVKFEAKFAVRIENDKVVDRELDALWAEYVEDVRDQQSK
jgi:hypothetical protein